MEQRCSIPERCPRQGGPPTTHQPQVEGRLADPPFLAASAHVLTRCLFPYREHPQKTRTFHPQPQAEEPADGLASANAPWTLVPGCCTPSPSPTSLGLHLTTHYALSSTHCVSLPFQLPHATEYLQNSAFLHHVRGL